MDKKELYKLQCFRLASVLLANEIPFKLEEIFDGYGIIIYDKENNKLMDAVMHSHSYGANEGLFEIAGGMTREELRCDEVLGNLTFDEVFKRMHICWEWQRSII